MTGLAEIKPPEAVAMARFIATIEERPRWLMLRAMRYSRRHGFDRFTALGEAAWHMAISGLSGSLILALKSDPAFWEVEAFAPRLVDAMTVFATNEAAAHRRRGVPPEQFLAFLQYFRQSYFDLIRFSGFDPVDRRALQYGVLRFFDRLQVRIAGEWLSLDETERMRELRLALSELAHQRSVHHAVFESVTSAMFLVYEQGESLFLNAAARRFAEGLAGTDQLTGLLGDPATGDLTVSPFGQRVFVRHRYPVPEARRARHAAVVVFEDVTEARAIECQRERLRAQMEQLRKTEAVATLAGGIAHEINNLLQPIIGMTGSVVRGLDDGSRDAEALHVVIEAAERIREIVGGIQQFARGAGDGIEPVDAEADLKRAITLMRGSLPEGIEIRFEVVAGVPVVAAAAGAVTQCAVNLIINAIHAMEDRSGVIAVRLCPWCADDPDFGADATLVGGGIFRVTDTGVGMPPSVLERCLEPFFTTKPAGVGTGLGLAVVHGMVSSAGGRLAVRSVKGEGTTVSAFLPAANPDRLFAVDVDERR